MTQNLIIALMLSPMIVAIIVGIRILIKYEPTVTDGQYDENGNPK